MSGGSEFQVCEAATENARRANSVAAPHTWNSLPSDIRSCHTLVGQSFTAHMPLLTATSTFELVRRRRSSSQLSPGPSPYHSHSAVNL